MKNKAFFLVALVFGLLTSYLIYDYLVKVETKMTTIEYGEVVVTACDITAKTILTAEMLEIRKIPTEYIHSQALCRMDEALGRVATAPLAKGEQLLKGKTAKWGDLKNGLSYLIPEGRRALTVSVDEVSGVAGLIRPGDRVDVLAVINIFNEGRQKEEPYSVVVLQDIEVLAVGKNMEPQNKDSQAEAKTVTLAVTVEESAPLALASQKGALRLMLRSPLDSSKKTARPFSPKDFLN